MENLRIEIENLDFTLEIDDLLDKNQSLIQLALATRVVFGKVVNLEALLRVQRRSWTKNEGLDLRVLGRTTFMFYFEEVDELETVLNRAPWNFENHLLVVSRVLLGIFLFLIPLYYGFNCVICLWTRGNNLSKGLLIELDRCWKSINGTMRSIKVRKKLEDISFQCNVQSVTVDIDGKEGDFSCDTKGRVGLDNVVTGNVDQCLGLAKLDS